MEVTEMSEPAYSTREIQRGRQGKPANATPQAPPRGDAGSLLHGPPRGHSTRGATERIAYFNEQKKVVAAREAQKRAAENHNAQARQLDSDVASTSSRLQNLKRQRAETERNKPAESTFG